MNVLRCLFQIQPVEKTDFCKIQQDQENGDGREHLKDEDGGDGRHQDPLGRQESDDDDIRHGADQHPFAGP